MRDQDQQPSMSELATRLYAHVDRLAGLIDPRHLEKPESIEATLGLIKSELSSSGYDVEKQNYPIGDFTATNLIAEIIGNRRPDEVIVLGAHYDTTPTTPGADDNASAVAVLLECARLLRKCSPKRTIRFVAFACEERPHFHTNTMGSQVYARRCRERGERIRGMICLEMVGYYTSEQGSQRFPDTLPRWVRFFYPSKGNFIASVANLRSWRLGLAFRRGFKRTTRFPLYSIALPERISEIRRSDNSSFWDQGYPALMISDTSFLRNPHYHMPSDLPNTLNYDSMAQVALGTAGSIAWLAGGQMPEGA